MPTRDDAIAALKEIVDPEIGLDLWTLGLIYELIVEGDKARIKMTFTSPMCPYGPQILFEVKEGLAHKGFKPEVELTFEPVWQPSDEVKMLLGLT